MAWILKNIFVGSWRLEKYETANNATIFGFDVPINEIYLYSCVWLYAVFFAMFV
jgi:hypothetical protein